MPQIKFSAFSGKGRREYNQDASLACQIGPDSWFFAVADGMGGTAGGEVASNTVLEAARSVLAAVLEKPEEPELKELLKQVYLRAHQEILDAQKQNPGMQGMGTTLTCLLIHKSHFAWANLGDSRIYLLRGDKLDQITKDHTYIQEYIDQHGTATRTMSEQYGHFLIKVIDGQGQQPDLFPPGGKHQALKEGDVFLLCSDGLIIDKVYTNTSLLKNYLVGTANLEEACESLYQYAFHAGSDDNITLVLVEIGTLKRKPLNLRKYPAGSNLQNNMNPSRSTCCGQLRRWLAEVFRRKKNEKQVSVAQMP